MRKFFILISLSLSLMCWSAPTMADIGPRAKILAMSTFYGTVGGLLIGTASMVFDTGGRAWAKGASIGLYAGLIFGTYVIVSHQIAKNAANSPPEEIPAYGGDDGGYGGYGSDDDYGDYEAEQRSREWRLDINRVKDLNRLEYHKVEKSPLEFSLNLVNYQF